VDCMLKVEGQTWDVHALILSAKSPVFTTMLNKAAQFTEATTRTISFPEEKISTISLLIDYLYQGFVVVYSDINFNEILALARIAHEYQINDLLIYCVLYLGENSITRETILEIFQFADKLNIERLKKSCIDWISKNVDLNNRELDSTITSYDQFIKIYQTYQQLGIKFFTKTIEDKFPQK